MDYEPPPRDPESEARGHELRAMWPSARSSSS